MTKPAAKKNNNSVGASGHAGGGAKSGHAGGDVTSGHASGGGATSAVRCAFHVLIFAIYSYTVYYDTYQLRVTIGRETYGGRWKFLTFWNLLLQWLYFGYSIVNDIFGSNLPPSDNKAVDQRSTLQRLRDILATSIIFPIGLFVVTTFWSIYAVDREMIFPAALDQLIPTWLNHAWHSTVVVYLLIEKFLVHHRYPSRGTGLSFCVAFALVYQIWIFWIAYTANIWVYPILEAFNWPLRIAFLAACWVLIGACYCVGEFVTRVFWRSYKVNRQEKLTRKTN